MPFPFEVTRVGASAKQGSKLRGRNGICEMGKTSPGKSQNDNWTASLESSQFRSKQEEGDSGTKIPEKK